MVFKVPCILVVALVLNATALAIPDTASKGRLQLIDDEGKVAFVAKTLTVTGRYQLTQAKSDALIAAIDLTHDGPTTNIYSLDEQNGGTFGAVGGVLATGNSGEINTLREGSENNLFLVGTAIKDAGPPGVIASTFSQIEGFDTTGESSIFQTRRDSKILDISWTNPNKHKVKCYIGSDTTGDLIIAADKKRYNKRFNVPPSWFVLKFEPVE